MDLTHMADGNTAARRQYEWKQDQEDDFDIKDAQEGYLDSRIFDSYEFWEAFGIEGMLHDHKEEYYMKLVLDVITGDADPATLGNIVATKIKQYLMLGFEDTL